MALPWSIHRGLPRRVVPWSGDGGPSTRPFDKNLDRDRTLPVLLQLLEAKSLTSKANPTRRIQHKWGGSTPTTPLLSVRGCEWGPTPLSSLTSTQHVTKWRGCKFVYYIVYDVVYDTERYIAYDIVYDVVYDIAYDIAQTY